MGNGLRKFKENLTFSGTGCGAPEAAADGDGDVDAAGQENKCDDLKLEDAKTENKDHVTQNKDDCHIEDTKQSDNSTEQVGDTPTKNNEPPSSCEGEGSSPVDIPTVKVESDVKIVVVKDDGDVASRDSAEVRICID